MRRGVTTKRIVTLSPARSMLTVSRPDGVHIVVLSGACTASHGEGMIGWRKECALARRHAGHAVEGTHAVEVERMVFVDESSQD